MVKIKTNHMFIIITIIIITIGDLPFSNNYRKSVPTSSSYIRLPVL